MRFDAGKYKERAREDFERAWHEGPEVLTPPTGLMKYPRLRYGQARPHPVFATIHRLREVYLNLGFEECCNPLIVDEQDVYRQF
ncbi:MAG: O-phosphoserine--tRNA ligase, partial [Methanomicrobiales archaeon]|nr:O-phosphoserine--tRNA ligase [Methanomicrobiales archaeon]